MCTERSHAIGHRANFELYTFAPVRVIRCKDDLVTSDALDA